MTERFIDRYLILSIPRNIKRQWAVLMGAAAMGVPYEIIRFARGEDAKDYAGMESIAKAAAKDGYPFLNQFAIGQSETYVRQSAGNVALFWSWARVLKKIAESGMCTLLTWDDRIPRIPFVNIEQILKQLYKKPNFYIWQLRLRSPIVHLAAGGRPEYDIENWEEESRRDAYFFQNCSHNIGNLEQYVDAFLQEGLLGYDETMVLSPRGAEWLLKEMMTMEDRTEELRSFEFPDVDGCYTEETIVPRMRSRLNNDNWLCWGLDTTEAESAGAKFYTPRKIGYEFFHEPLEFDSNVHWDNRVQVGWYTPRKVQVDWIY